MDVGELAAILLAMCVMGYGGYHRWGVVRLVLYSVVACMAVLAVFAAIEMATGFVWYLSFRL